VSGLEIEDLVLGSGAQAVRNSTVKLHLVCKLNRGDFVRSTYNDGRPESFRVGARDVIAGLEKGVVGMRVGGKRRLRVSPHLAYRDVGAGPIPPNAVLVFELELLEVLAPVAE
jgi:FKBP-type peptidyl-prolyl cis-trans isomerase